MNIFLPQVILVDNLKLPHQSPCPTGGVTRSMKINHFLTYTLNNKYFKLLIWWFWQQAPIYEQCFPHQHPRK